MAAKRNSLAFCPSDGMAQRIDQIVYEKNRQAAMECRPFFNRSNIIREVITHGLPIVESRMLATKKG